MTETLLDQVETTLTSALDYNTNAEVAPIVLLWPDRDRQFETIARRLRGRLRLLTLGDYEPAAGAGPAYWLRCAIAGEVPAGDAERTPVVYLPGVARDDLRAIEDCPPELAPIAELQYRGKFFSHPNGRDWTLRGLLANREAGLGLDISEDPATTGALRGALEELVELPVHRLAAQHVNASYLQNLLSPDPIGSMLEWLDDPIGFRQRLDERRWEAFVEQAKRDYAFDPEAEGEVTAGRRLGERQGSWAAVWSRYERDPGTYAGVEERLRKGKPTDVLFSGHDQAWPQDNEEAEGRLRSALLALDGATQSAARTAVIALWREHRARRTSVWAKLDRAPLVLALEQLEQLADLTAVAPATDLGSLLAKYEQEGWRVDAAFTTSLAAAQQTDDRAAVAAAASALYRPWLESHAKAFQAALGPNASNYASGPPASSEAGVVTIFVDGLRLDVARRLEDRLGGLEVELTTSLAALPTVTDTAKAALAPVPEAALMAGKEFAPARASSGATADVGVLRGLMKERGLQILQAGETGDPSGTAWTEIAEIDSRGHAFGTALVDDLDDQVALIAKRVKALLDAGWQRVEIVTDHGWLLLPGGLEKVELPVATTEKKKGRCARLKDGASVEVPTVPWHWDPDVRIALAPGITCFEAGKEYEHGGVSLQECVAPRLRVHSGATRAATGGATITKVTWLGLLCRVEFEHVAPGATLDIRALAAEASSSVAEDAKETTTSGRGALFVADEDLEGQAAFVVIVAPDGRILAQRDVTIGSNR